MTIALYAFLLALEASDLGLPIPEEFDVPGFREVEVPVFLSSIFTEGNKEFYIHYEGQGGSMDLDYYFKHDSGRMFVFSYNQLGYTQLGRVSAEFLRKHVWKLTDSEGGPYRRVTRSHYTNRTVKDPREIDNEFRAKERSWIPMSYLVDEKDVSSLQDFALGNLILSYESGAGGARDFQRKPRYFLLPNEESDDVSAIATFLKENDNSFRCPITREVI